MHGATDGSWEWGDIMLIKEWKRSVTVLLLLKDSVRSVTIKGDLVESREAEGERHTGLTEG